MPNLTDSYRPRLLQWYGQAFEERVSDPAQTNYTYEQQRIHAAADLDQILLNEIGPVGRWPRTLIKDLAALKQMVQEGKDPLLEFIPREGEDQNA